jgi:penicillin-binding protein 2
MFIFDMLKRNDGRLRIVALLMAFGMVLLLGGLWFVQIVQAERFETNLKKQSFRTVRLPAIRGRILDCNGQILANELPRYNAILYLEDLQDQFHEQYVQLVQQYEKAHPPAHATGKIVLSATNRAQLQLEADCNVVSNITYRVSTTLEEPRALNTNAFLHHYNDHPYVPFQIVPDLAPRQIAIFAEQLSGQPDIEVETQPVRDYPNGSLAAHVIGYVKRIDAVDGSEISFTIPDYQGESGIEYVFDEDLRGQAGVKSVLVNNQNYRQSEVIDTPDEPGNDVYLTLDLGVQRAAESALFGVRGAAVVLDVRNGDVLALASAPAFDPNSYVRRLSTAEMEKLNDPTLRPQLNRAVTGAYPPGSTFKIITGLACLENGLNPDEIFDSPGEYRATPDSRPIRDTAGPGPFNFERAIYLSCNTYFIHYGRQTGLRKILAMARRFHLGEKTDIDSGQETPTHFPGPEDAGKSLRWSSEADVCIGQEIVVTPLQMAGMISVIANGGTLYRPRIASHSCDVETGATNELTASGRVWDHVEISPRLLEIIRHAMLQDTEHPGDATSREANAYNAFHREGGVPKLENFRVAGKTGTAEVRSPSLPYRRVTWFDSYGPFESPRYAVVVMVEDGASGGTTCAPMAERIYEALLKRDLRGPSPGISGTLAHN